MPSDRRQRAAVLSHVLAAVWSKIAQERGIDEEDVDPQEAMDRAERSMDDAYLWLEDK